MVGPRDGGERASSSCSEHGVKGLPSAGGHHDPEQSADDLDLVHHCMKSSQCFLRLPHQAQVSSVHPVQSCPLIRPIATRPSKLGETTRLTLEAASRNAFSTSLAGRLTLEAASRNAFSTSLAGRLAQGRQERMHARAQLHMSLNHCSKAEIETAILAMRLARRNSGKSLPRALACDFPTDAHAASPKLRTEQATQATGAG